jgi:hypothetical protein
MDSKTEQACPTQGFMGIPPFDYTKGRGAQGPMCDEPMGRRLTREAMEPSVRELLLQRARLLRVKAEDLEALADQLPVRMTPQAAEGLMQLLFPG